MPSPYCKNCKNSLPIPFCSFYSANVRHIRTATNEAVMAVGKHIRRREATYDFSAVAGPSGRTRSVGGRWVCSTAIASGCERASSLKPGGLKNLEINPMKQDHSRLSQAPPRCGAKTRGGTPCHSPPMAGRKRCRLHGGLSPGAPRGSRNGNFRQGDWTLEAIAERKWVRSLVRSFGNPEKSHD